MDIKRKIGNSRTIIVLITLWLYLFMFGAMEAFASQLVYVRMRDGVSLKTEVNLPSGSGPWPAILSRGYSTGSCKHIGDLTSAGYACVGQQCRGGGGEDGSRFFPDIEDGYDCIEWVSKQSWCNGKVAMCGRSYWGATQWRAALSQHPALKAIIPMVMNPDIWERCYRAHGAVTLGMTSHGRATGGLGTWDYFMKLPLIDLDNFGSGDNKLWNDYINNSQFKGYWDKISIRLDGKDGQFNKIRIPTYIVAGYYDYYAGASFQAWQQLRKVNATKEVRIIVDPGDHLGNIVGNRGFGPGARISNSVYRRWLDHVMKGADNGIEKEPPVRMFVMGINKWRSYNEYPVPKTGFVKYYFSSPTGAKDGALTTTLPGNEKPTQYAYDPKNPCPTLGASSSFAWGSNANNSICPVGPYDQRKNGLRKDVLVFRTPPLKEDTEVIGPIKIKLYAAIDAKCTDWVGQLIDEYPDGKSLNLIEGIIRARFRESIYEAPKLLVPGKIYEYDIDLQMTANVFLKGHRIRVHLSSSMFPLWDRNLNTGDNIATGTRMQVAHQTIYHDKDHPSHILLPIIGGQTVSFNLSKDTLNFAAVLGQGNPSSQTVKVAGEGGLSLNGLVTYESTGWLDVTKEISGSQATLTNKVNIGQLAVGSYSTKVNIGAQNVWKSYTVTLTVKKPGIFIRFLPNEARAPFNIVARGMENAIDFTVILDQAGTFSLNVYDMSGEKVWRYCQSDLSAGKHRITWNFDLMRRPSIGSGIYLAIVKHKGQQMIRRIPIMR